MMMFQTIEQAIEDLQAGKPIIVVDDENRENEGDFVALSEKITPEVINFMISKGKGLVCTTITEALALHLQLPAMASESTDPYGTAFTVSIDHQSTTTGISANERSATIKAMIDPNAKAAEFKRPGHVFPLVAKEGGVLERAGHTEASVDLAKLSHAFPSATICEIIKEDGTMARLPDLLEIAEQFDLSLITIEALQAYRKRHEKQVTREVETVLPTKYGTFDVVGYTNYLDDKEHIALVKGDVTKEEPVLVRIHSECLTGDVFSSYRCDCGPQLEAALQQIEEHGSGVLIYMRQEGRGIGLLNKLKAYKLQDEGLDTVEANTKLGFVDDLREYDLSAQILLDLGVSSVQLLTNNPHKLTGLERHAIKIHKRIPLEVPVRKENMLYMKTKHMKLGHLFEDEQTTIG